MAGPQKQSSVVLRNDLRDMMEELKFEDLGLQADSIAPPIYVGTQAGAYPVLPREAVGKIPDTRRGPGGTFTRGEWDWGQDTFACFEYGYEEPMDYTSLLENEEFMNEEEITSQLAVRGLLLGREARIADKLLDETFWAGVTNLKTLGTEWDNVAADPWADIEAAALVVFVKCGKPKTQLTLITTWDNVQAALRTTKATTDAKYTIYVQTLAGPAKISWLRDYLGIKEVKVVQSMYDTSGLGADTKFGRFWSNEYGFLGYISDGMNSLKNQNVIRQIVWTKYSRDYILESYEQPNIHSQIIRTREYRGIKMNKDYGILINNMKTTVDPVTGI